MLNGERTSDLDSADPYPSMKTDRHVLIRSLFDEYIQMDATRDDRLTSRFSKNFSGFAGGGTCLVKDVGQWIAITRQDFAQITEHLRIEMLDVSLQDLSDQVVAVTAFFHIHLPIPDHILSREIARLTLIFRLEANDWMIVYSGISIPYHLVQEGEVYPLKSLAERNTALEREVADRTLELREANFKLELLSNTDGLTGAANRRCFDSVLREEWNRAQRSGLPLALILMDVDHFKTYNDCYGHLAGDDCLRALAMSMLKEVRRAAEIVARFGGEEFVILMPDSSEEQVLATAKRIQDAVAKLAIKHSWSPTGQVTLSLGVARAVPAFGLSPDNLIASADAALYRAKSLGRNRIEVVSLA